jgi:hypothetical protein
MLVAPIVDSSGVRNVYLPPGEWVDYFTGARYQGDRSIQVKCSLETLPLFVRSGSIIPQQPDMDYTDQRPVDSLIVHVYAPGNSSYLLYEDDGISLDYEQGKSALTPFSCTSSGSACRITIGPTKGEFAGQTVSRSHLLNIVGLPKPASVRIDGMNIAPGGSASNGWYWDAQKQALTVSVGRRNIRHGVSVEIRNLVRNGKP